MKKLTQEKFISKAMAVHSNRYDYSVTNYINHRQKVNVICSVHGIFEQLAGLHLQGRGCPKCGGTTKLTTNDFIDRSKLAHDNLYEYESCNYISDAHKVLITCKKHGDFLQRPADHLNGRGCPQCGGTSKSTKQQFVEKSQAVHGDRYDYSNSIYVNDRSKLMILCRQHGQFHQTPNDHIQGVGCPICGGTGKLTTQQFTDRAKLVHGDKYDYENVFYTNSHSKVLIECHEHGNFYQKSYVHLNGSGCPMCKESKGERAIRKFLVKNGIEFKSQYRFDDCRNVNPLPFDFAVETEDGLVLIEYQGEQHFKPVGFGGNPKMNFSKVQKNDEIKRKFCKVNNYRLIEVPYYSKNLEDILLIPHQPC